MVGTVPALVNLPPGSEQVTDADEEVFLLYSLLASASPGNDETGLGFVDSKKGEITVAFDLSRPERGAVSPAPGGSTSPRGREKGRKRRSSGKIEREEGRHVEVTLAQDLSGLRNRKGDTGSVLWRASIHLAELILQDHYYPPAPPALPLLDPSLLSTAHILELGSGTGLLSVLLSPLVRKYTATDIPALLPLLRKNCSPSGATKVEVEELDWVTLSQLREERKHTYFPLPSRPDLVLAVDCLYNPALLSPFLSTISYLSHPRPCAPSSSSSSSETEEAAGRETVVLVMSELRDPEVMRQFLEGWLELDRERGGWEVWRGGEGVMRGTRCVMWVGWRVGGML